MTNENFDSGDVLRRLQHLEDQAAIARLLARYGHCLDYGLEEAWADCFASDGIFDVRRATPSGGLYRGHAELVAFARAHTRAPEHLHKHMIVDPVVEIDGDAAHVESYFLRVDHLSGRPTLRTFGRYMDALERQQGQWRIRHRVAEVESRLPA